MPAALRCTPSAWLAALVRTRDGHCRFPGWTVPAPSCNLDHATPFHHTDPERGAQTVASNLAWMCRWHYRMKTQDRLVRMGSDATQHRTGPDDQKLTSVPIGMPDDPRTGPAGCGDTTEHGRTGRFVQVDLGKAPHHRTAAT